MVDFKIGQYVRNNGNGVVAMVALVLNEYVLVDLDKNYDGYRNTKYYWEKHSCEIVPEKAYLAYRLKNG